MKLISSLIHFLTLFLTIGFVLGNVSISWSSPVAIDYQIADFHLSKSLDQSNKSNTKVKILSWNIYMLPAKSFLFTKQEQRAKLIVETLIQSDYDVIVFQEAFHQKAFNILSTSLKQAFPYQIGPANKGGLIKTNSGIWIISKLPIKEVGTMKFEDCHGVDCIAKKGALLVEAKKDGHTFQILGTHMQASGGDDNRRKQFKQLTKELILPNKKNKVPQILCGDYNISQESPLYDELIETLAAENGELKGKWQKTSTTPDYGKPQNIIDYIFYKGNGKKPLKIKRSVQRITKKWQLKKENRLDLSDHFGVSLEVVF